MNKKILKIFLLFAIIHCAVFVLYPAYGLSSFNDRIAWFGVNAYPWWPLYKLGLPVTYRTFLIRPNPLGWAWCIFVWVTFYYGLARVLTLMTNRERKTIESDSIELTPLEK